MRVLTPFVFTVAAWLVACGDSAGPEPLVVDRVELSATSLTLGPSASQTLVATARTAGGAVVPNRSVAWTSSDNAIVTVSSGGQVVGVSLGTGTVTATIDGKSATASVAVIATAPTHLAASIMASRVVRRT
jgi:uncharacterized protein YjdB